MPKFLFVAAAVAAALLAQPANAGFETPRPPSTLSPDLTEPWVVQVKPGKRAFISDPTPRRTAFVPGAYKAPIRVRSMDPAYLPRIVEYAGKERPGTIVIDTGARYLYLILDGGTARRFGVGVGREGFEWSGVQKISSMAKWPAWTPPEEMRKRQPYLPESMKGGPANPLGARAMYLGDSIYRIHGSNEPWTIGRAVSSGCIRMRNEDVIDLYNHVRVGTRVVVL